MAFLPAVSQIYPIKVDRKWGLVDASGKMVASPRYDAINTIDDEHSVVVLNGKYGMLSSSGAILIEPQYTYLRASSKDLILINQGGDCEAGDCSGGKWGLVHLKNGERIEPTFNLIGKFDDNGLALVNIGGDCGYSDCRGGTWGIVDTTGALRVEAIYESVQIGNGTEAYLKTAAGWGMYNLARNRMMIKPIYGELQRVGPNRVTMKTDGKYGVLTDEGDTLISPRYDGIRDATHGFLAYRENHKFGLMDSVGKHHTTARFDLVEVSDYGWVLVKNDSKWGLVDMQDREIIGTVLRKVGRLGPDYAAVQRGPLWGVIGRDGSFLIQDKYEYMDVVNDSLFLVKDRKYHKWINKSGQVVRTYLFEEIAGWVGNVARARMKKGWGLINRRGEWIAPPRFDEIDIFQLVAKGRKDRRWQYFYFDADGSPDQIKRLVLIKGDEEEEFDNGMTSASAVGWFFSNAKQLWGLRNPNNNRLLIAPQYIRIEIVPGTNLSIGFADISPGGDRGWALIDHVRGTELHPPLFSKIYTTDFMGQNVARVTYATSGRFALLSNGGKLSNFDGAAYIGPFTGDVARINLGGYLEWTETAGSDSLAMEMFNDRQRRQMVARYQYCRKGKWGFVNRKGELVCPAKFEMAMNFDNGIGRVKQEGKWGLIDETFNLVVKPQYDFIENLIAEGERILFTVGMEKQRYGFIDGKGETTIEPRFAEVGEFHEGLVRVKEGKLWGYANLKGDIVIPPQYKEAGDFYEGRARIRNDRYWGYIDTTGQPMTPEKYLRAGDFHEGFAWVQSGKFFGYLGLQGGMVIEPEYTEAADFSEGLAVVKRKGGYGLIDYRGRWVAQPRFYRLNEFHDSLAVVQEDAKYGLVNPRGEFVVRPVFREMGDFSEGLAVARENLEFGYLNQSGEMRIPCQFANAGPFGCGRAPVFINGKWGFIDTTGTVQVENKFSRVRGFFEDRAAVRQGDLWGFIDPAGRMAVPAIYKEVGDFDNGRAAVFIEGSGWGFVNADGTLVVPCLYEKVGTYRNGMVAVKKAGKWGLINPFGAPVTLLKYDEIRPYGEGLAPVMVKRKMGVVDATGKVLLPATYDMIKPVGSGIQVEYNDNIGYLNTAGEWIWQPSK